MDNYLEEHTNKLIDRLEGMQTDTGQPITIVSAASERILIDYGGGAHYLFLLVTSKRQVTPGLVEQRVRTWQQLKGKRVLGSVVLCTNAGLSPTLRSRNGENLPPNVAVVGRWDSRNELIASHIDEAMSHLLVIAGISPSEATRVAQKQPISQSQVSIQLQPSSLREADYEDNRPMLPLVPQKGTCVDRYRLKARLGRGMSAEVWKASVESTPPGIPLKKGAQVAVKIYFTSLLHGAQSLRIQREFGIASQLFHPNLVRVYDLMISPSRPFHTFLAMEFVEGPTLKQFVGKQGPLDVGSTMGIARQLFEGLRELHSFGALHRDVKAANILLAPMSNGTGFFTLKLSDFGIVAAEDEESFTMGSIFLGSKHSSPLEQLTGQTLDRRVDIYGAGTVLYHCYRGIPLYADAGPEGAIVRRMLEAPERLDYRTNNPDRTEKHLVEFINRCISVDRSDRPDSAEECLSILK